MKNWFARFAHTQSFLDLDYLEKQSNLFFKLYLNPDSVPVKTLRWEIFPRGLLQEGSAENLLLQRIVL